MRVAPQLTQNRSFTEKWNKVSLLLIIVCKHSSLQLVTLSSETTKTSVRLLSFSPHLARYCARPDLLLCRLSPFLEKKFTAHRAYFPLSFLHFSLFFVSLSPKGHEIILVTMDKTQRRCPVQILTKTRTYSINVVGIYLGT